MGTESGRGLPGCQFLREAGACHERGAHRAAVRVLSLIHSRGARAVGEPNSIVQLTLVAFLLAVALAFSLLPPRRAVLWTVLGGWLFLPHFDGNHRFLFLHSKFVFLPAAVLMGSAVFDARRWLGLRPKLLDLPMVALCVSPFFTALDNSLGMKEALAATLGNLLGWGGPYLLGRLYLGDLGALRELARAQVAAALAYVPFCLWEIRMSPQLHVSLYGFRSWSFDQSLRFGGFRPSVFMQHGLAVGMWMAMGTLVSYWLVRTRSPSSIAGIPGPVVLATLLVTTVLCRSTAAIALLACGVALLELTDRLRTGVLVLAVGLLPAAYCTARMSGWTGAPVVDWSRHVVGEDRAASLQFRLDNEAVLAKKALLRPWLGWGRFGRSFIYDENGRSLGAVPDGLWIIFLGMSGLVGLSALGLVLATPPLLVLRTYPGRAWADPRLAPTAALVVTLLLWAVDGVLNAMVTPVVPMVAGALVSVVLLARATRNRPRGATPPLGESSPADRGAASRNRASPVGRGPIDRLRAPGPPWPAR